MSETDTAPAERRIVTLTEFALIVRRSENAIRAFLRSHPDFPVAERGKNGVAYQIDLDAALPWWREHHQRESERERERARQIELWSREVYPGGEDDAGARPVTPAERKAIADAVRTEDYNRLRRGELLERAPLERALADAVVATRKELLALPAEFCRRHGHGRDMRIDLERMIRNRLNRLADELGRVAPAESEEEEPLARAS